MSSDQLYIIRTTTVGPLCDGPCINSMKCDERCEKIKEKVCTLPESRTEDINFLSDQEPAPCSLSSRPGVADIFTVSFCRIVSAANSMKHMLLSFSLAIKAKHICSSHSELNCYQVPSSIISNQPQNRTIDYAACCLLASRGY